MVNKEPWIWQLEDRKAVVVEGRCIRVQWSPRLGFEISPEGATKEQLYRLADKINKRGEINVHLWKKKWRIRSDFLTNHKSPAKEVVALTYS